MTDKEIMDYMEKGITVTRSIEILNPIRDKHNQSEQYFEGYRNGYEQVLDRVLKIVDKWTDFALKGNGFMTALGELRNEIKALKGEHG